MVAIGNCHWPESECLEEELISGTLWHVAAFLSCHYLPEASHSQLASSEEVGMIA